MDEPLLDDSDGNCCASFRCRLPGRMGVLVNGLRIGWWKFQVQFNVGTMMDHVDLAFTHWVFTMNGLVLRHFYVLMCGPGLSDTSLA